jgi:guanylate kinase
VVKVFIVPPSMIELRRRLESRASDDAKAIKRRMSNAYSEISRWDGYDYVLLNEDLDDCYRQLQSIVAAERLRRQRQPWLPGYVTRLLQEDT